MVFGKGVPRRRLISKKVFVISWTGPHVHVLSAKSARSPNGEGIDRRLSLLPPQLSPNGEGLERLSGGMVLLIER